jgi:Domain of unknown function (DUF4159)
MHMRPSKAAWTGVLPLVGLLLLTSGFAHSQDETPAPTALSGDKVQCANLIYAGNKTSKCFSDRFLKRLSLETRIHTEDHFRTVRLDSRDLSNYPFSIMTGEGGFNLTEKERVQLRYYLTHGGFLLASAGCSSPEWVRSFRSEFARLFPGQQMTRLKLDHPIFRMVYKIDSLSTIHGTHGSDGAVLESYAVKGKVVLVFSSDGLNDTSHAENCCCCGGDEIDKSEFINVDVLAYALLH